MAGLGNGPVPARSTPARARCGGIVAQFNTDVNDNEYKLYKAVIAKFGRSLPLDASAASGYQGMFGFVRTVNAASGRRLPPTNGGGRRRRVGRRII